MDKRKKHIVLICVFVAVLVLGGVAALVISNGRMFWPRRTTRIGPIEFRVDEVSVLSPGDKAFESALHQPLPLEEFGKIVKAHPEARDEALVTFAYNNMTNYVRMLIQYGADASEPTLDRLNLSGMSNATSLIRGVLDELKDSKSSAVERLY